MTIEELIKKAQASADARSTQTISIDDWDEVFTQVPNLFQDPTGEELTPFETYGEELEFVKRQPENHVWTVLDGEDDKMYLAAGMHFVNRVNYIVTEEAWTPEFKDIDVVYYAPEMNADPLVETDSKVDSAPSQSK